MLACQGIVVQVFSLTSWLPVSCWNNEYFYILTITMALSNKDKSKWVCLVLVLCFFFYCHCLSSQSTCSFHEPWGAARWATGASLVPASPKLPSPSGAWLTLPVLQPQELTSTCLSTAVFSLCSIYLYITSCCSTQLVLLLLLSICRDINCNGVYLSLKTLLR